MLAPAGKAAPARPIGVFDSGVGGLTVLRALRSTLPAESFVYLGDTARLPYGTKSAHTVVRYALQAAEVLVARDIKCLVVACNTASAAALPAMRERFAELPVIGVVEPGARAACAASSSGRMAVLATESTVRA
ncbi:MAG TPA: aspartate/glutamate racemase family protein, partial [Steroidobacteraceae bacterium]|nr:aspartate/glutamate racemase family protein [Steroidobacteraceae bacterium]